MAPRKRKSVTTPTESISDLKKGGHKNDIVEKEGSPSSELPPARAASSPLSDLDAQVEAVTNGVETKDEGFDDEPLKKKVKKAAVPKVKEPVTPIHPHLPNNKTLPDPLPPFPPRPSGQVRISAWNVCGMKAAEKKGMLRYLEAEDADVLVLTETKMNDPGFPQIHERYPHSYWGVDPNKKGYSGTAILTKIEPISITFGLPTSSDQASEAGRCITLEFKNHFLIGTYVPNAGQDLKTLPRKNQWNVDFQTYLHQLDAKKPVIWCGDLNVVPAEKDIRNWKTNHNKSAGVTDDEIQAFEKQLAGDGNGAFVDVWRRFNQEKEGYYTYFSLRFDCRTKGIGWRLDHFVVSERIFNKVKQCEIRLEVYGPSDHVPIMLDFEGEL